MCGDPELLGVRRRGPRWEEVPDWEQHGAMSDFTFNANRQHKQCHVDPTAGPGFLDSEGANKDVKVRCKFSVLDKAGVPVPSLSRAYKSIQTFTPKDSTWGYSKFISKADLEGSPHVIDDCFTIRCDVTVLKEIRCEEITKLKRRFVVVPPSNMCRDLGGLLESMDGATSRKLGFGHRAIFTLVPVQSRTGTNVSIGPGSCGQGPAGPRGGIGPGSSGPFGPGWWDIPGPMGLAPGPPPLVPKFSAHRSVLAARSSVFKAELFGSMMENAGDPVEIGDMESDVFKSLLHFIYTDDSPPEMTREDVVMAGHLLVAADRYDVERLKLICEDKLCTHIDSDNMATSLALAEQHSCPGLKEDCFEFLASPSNF
uniref:Speckle-type POZ protein-like protein n=1 Tax=Aegilops tauschii TaxID=37682 RepID=M8BQ87_AEGTA